MHRNEWTMFYGVKRIKSNVNKYKLKYISILSVADATYSTNLSWAVNLISTFLSIQIQSINLKLNMKGINNVQRYTSNANIKNKGTQRSITILEKHVSMKLLEVCLLYFHFYLILPEGEDKFPYFSPKCGKPQC